MTEFEALTDRVRILEQRSRRLRNVGVVLALSVIASFAFAQQRQGAAPRIPDVIEAKKFVVKDDNGVARAELRPDALAWYEASRTKDSIPVAGVQVTPDNKGHVYASELVVARVVSDNVIVSDTVNALGGTVTAQQFAVKNDRATTVAVLRNNPVFGPQFDMYDIDGKTSLVRLGLTIDNAGSLLLKGKNPQIILLGGGPKITLAEGTSTRAVLGTTELEVTKTGSTETRAPSSLVLFDKDGKVIWKAP